MIKDYNPAWGGDWWDMNGIKLMIQKPGGKSPQKLYYNGQLYI